MPSPLGKVPPKGEKEVPWVRPRACLIIEVPAGERGGPLPSFDEIAGNFIEIHLPQRGKAVKGDTKPVLQGDVKPVAPFALGEGDMTPLHVIAKPRSGCGNLVP